MIRTLLTSIGVILMVCLFLLYTFQRSLIYFPLSQEPKPKDYQATDLQVVSLETKDGLTLKAWYKPATAQQATILYFHGNSGNIGHRMTLARQFIHAGFGILLVEYRGFSGNAGSPSEQGFYEDARAGLSFLQAQGVLSKHVVVYGESIGTGVATQLAVEHRFCAVILQSPFTSLTDAARYHYPWLFIKTWDRFNSLEKIKAIHAPLLILHGKQDQVIPYQQGLILFNEAVDPKEMIGFAGHGHNDLWTQKQFAKEIIRFIRSKCI